MAPQTNCTVLKKNKAKNLTKVIKIDRNFKVNQNSLVNSKLPNYHLKETRRMKTETSFSKVCATSGTYPTLHNVNSISPNWKKLAEVLELNKKKTNNTNKSKEFIEKTGRMAECNSGKEHSSVHKNKIPIWFDDVDELMETPQKSGDSSAGLTKYVAMDCEMVGIGDDGNDSMVARVSMVNSMGECIYDKYVKPQEKVTDYRTAVSGIRPNDINKGEDFKVVQKEVSDILEGRILVGHALRNDFQVLFLSHPRKKIRDTAYYKPFRKLVQGRTPSLKKLAEHFLGLRFQEGEHNSVKDAQVAMRLYTMHCKEWEKGLKTRSRQKPCQVKHTEDMEL